MATGNVNVLKNGNPASWLLGRRPWQKSSQNNVTKSDQIVLFR
jgi:hypothetical protein